VEYVSFSAHVDYLQNSAFIHSVVPDTIVLVHGEKNEMNRLKVALDRDIEQSWPSTHVPPVVMPANGVSVTLTFDKPIVADMVGSVATSVLHQMSSSQVEENNSEEDYKIDLEVPDKLVMVTEHFQSKIMKTSEMSQFSSCRIGQIEQQMIVPLPQDILQLREYNHINVIHMLLPHLQEVFDEVLESELEKGSSSNTKTKVCIQNVVMMEETSTGDQKDCVTVTWAASPTNDLIADCATGLLFQVLSTTHFLRACWLEAHKVKSAGVKRQNEESNGNTESNISTPDVPLSEDEAIVKRMKMGLLDPSRAFVHDNQVDGLIFEDMDPKAVALSKPKLDKIRLYLLNYKEGLFQSVSFSHNGLRLIIRAQEDVSSIDDDAGDDSLVLSEAYCYIHWGEKVADCAHSSHTRAQKKCNGHAHHASATACHAVVQSTSTWLREEISAALSRIEGTL
jgi:hypothetical protein